MDKSPGLGEFCPRILWEAKEELVGDLTQIFVSSLATGQVPADWKTTKTHIHTSAHTYTHIHIYSKSHTCMYTHIHTLTHARTHTYSRTHTLSNTFTHMHIHTHTLSHTHSHTHTHAHKHIFSHTHEYTHIYTNYYAHTQTHTLTHTHTHTHSHTKMIIVDRHCSKGEVVCHETDKQVLTKGTTMRTCFKGNSSFVLLSKEYIPFLPLWFH